MTQVSPLPFMVGIAGALVLFAAWLPLAVRESRRPYRWHEPPAPRPERHEAAPRPRLVVVKRAIPDTPAVVAPVVEPVEPRPRHAPAPRIAVVVAAFTVWSLWSLRGRDHR
jgi:hypothetical protein